MYILLIYWTLTTILGVYYLIKNPSSTDDPIEFNLFEVIAHILPSMIISPFIVPYFLFFSIKFKRPRN
jgi:hypothetical protein